MGERRGEKLEGAMAQLPFTVLWSPRFGLLFSFPELFHLGAWVCAFPG